MYDVVAEPLIGNLWVMCAVDTPSGIKTMKPSDLTALSLSKKEALTLCKKNVAAAPHLLAPYERDYPSPGVNIVTGDVYASSWLIFPERWAALAEQSHGDLLVAAPGQNAIGLHEWQISGFRRHTWRGRRSRRVTIGKADVD
jgi:hypothetical protein